MSIHHRSRSRNVLRAGVIPAALLMLGVMVWQGSTAAFTATTGNTGNTWSAASLTLTNDGDVGTFQAGTTAIFATGGTSNISVPQKTNFLIPGQTGTKCITVKATGNVPGPVLFNVSNLVTTPAPDLTGSLTVNVQYGPTAAASDAAAHLACDNWIKSVAPLSAPASATTPATPTGVVAVASGVLSGLSTTGVSTGWTTAGTATGEWGLFLIQWTLNSGLGNTLQGGGAGAAFNWSQTVGT
ncbi:hypothetical protein ABIB25_002936 [Nakamurella sp. UYEF19]|uniref:hypothetical protein n=1 Tax=Nakamurella sp. UYEF19 TaxID=1756392 RepID=UPI0033965F44